ncbi:MAG: lysylphosphatidylglycerol synthase transmembrane domain-containing protein [Acidimicrobiales bacterium]
MLERNVTSPRAEAVGAPPAVARSGSWAPLQRRRYPGDGLRFALGALLVIATASVAGQPFPTSLQINAFRLINDLPAFIAPPLLGVMQLGALGAVGALSLVALLGRRARLAPLLVVAGSASWGAARLLQQLVDESPPVQRVPNVIFHAAQTPGLAFPASHVAVAAAMATVSRGELSRPARRLAWLVVALIAVARVYVGAHLPIDVLGGLGVGWAVGALVNVIVGVRPAVPDAKQLAAALACAGRPARSVTAVSISPDAAARFILEVPGGRRMMKVLGRDDPESDWLRRAWRLAAFRQMSGDRVPASPPHRVDHEAYVTLLAERVGARIAPLVGTWSAGGTELIERQWVEGRPLRSGDECAGPLLVEVWRQLGLLETAGIAHRVLPSTQVLVDGIGAPWVIELGDARIGVDHRQIVASRAAALADLSLIVGAEASVTALVTALGHDALRETLALLQPIDLPPVLRRRLDRSPGRFEELRGQVGAACGVDTRPASGPVRVAARNLVPVAAAGGAVFILLTHVGQAGTALAAFRTADPAWVVVAAVAAALTYVLAGAVITLAAPVRIGFWRTVSAQVAAASANRASPAGLGGMALNIRYLEMSGTSRAEAGGVIALTSLTGFGVHIVLTTVLLVIIGRQSHLALGSDLDTTWPVIAIVLAASTVTGAAVWYWRLHRRLVRLLRAASAGVTLLAREPMRLALLVASSAGISLAYAGALDASVFAAGGHISITGALVVYLAASAVGALSPTPGGLGTLEAALVAGLSQQGVPSAAAVAGVLTYRLITYWLPVLPGLVFVAVLKRRNAL